MTEETKIREKAYEFWENDGRPEGSEQIYWHRAQEQLEAEAQQSDGDIPSSAIGGVESSVAQPMPLGNDSGNLETRKKKARQPKPSVTVTAQEAPEISDEPIDNNGPAKDGDRPLGDA